MTKPLIFLALNIMGITMSVVNIVVGVQHGAAFGVPISAAFLGLQAALAVQMTTRVIRATWITPATRGTQRLECSHVWERHVIQDFTDGYSERWELRCQRCGVVEVEVYAHE